MKKVVVALLIAGAIGLGVGCTEKLNEPQEEIQPITKKWFEYHGSIADSIFYTPVDSVVTICFESPVNDSLLEVFAVANAMLRDRVTHRHMGKGFYLFKTEPETDIRWLLALLRADSRVRFAYPVFAEGDCIMDVCMQSTALNEAIARFLQEPSLRERDSLFSASGLRILRTPSFLNDSYLLVQEEKATLDIFDVCNALFECGMFAYVGPNIYGFAEIDEP